MHEVGAGELDRMTKGSAQAPVLDEHARHREPEEREPGERQEVDPLEDGHARDGEREERDRAREQRAPRCVTASGRDDRGPEVAQAERQRPDDRPVCERDPAADERRADGERGRRKRDQEPAPEVVAVELDRVGDQLTDGPLSG